MDTTDTGQPASEAISTCFRHPRRETYVRCARCDRYICPDCMREAPVGFRCPDCVRQENKTVRQARTIFGGKTVTTPLATYALLLLNVAAYLVELAHPAVLDQFDNLGTGLVGPDGQYYVDDGHSYPGYQLIGVAHGEWYRLITSAFLHLPPDQGFFGITHILFNMYWLWLLGRILEDRLGRARFLAVYLVAALGGSVLGILVDPHQSSIGASGAIYGLAAAYFVITRRLHHHPLDRNRLIITFILWMVLTAGFTSWEGHLGGLLAGGIAAAGIAYAPEQRRVVFQAAVTAVLVAVLVVLVVLKSLELVGSI